MRKNNKSAKKSYSIMVDEAAPNVDYKYGPYDSVSEAFSVLTGWDALQVGLTVGIMNGDTIEEYWFESACEAESDLVRKNTGAADEEDITLSADRVLKLKDRGTADGKGYVILRKGIAFASQVTAENTIYEVRYDFDLGTGSVSIPSGCVLKFNGGKISGGTVTGDGTEIIGNTSGIFASTVTIAGTWNVPKISSSMIADASAENALRILVALSNADIQNIIDIEAGDYYFTFTKELEAGLELKSNTELILNGNLHLNANILTQYRIIRAKNCKNIKIHGSGIIDGDKINHDYETKSGTHEYGNGIFIVKSTDVDISGIEVQNCTGDGITLSQGTSTEYGDEMLPNKRIRISGVKLHDCRRQGISVTFAENLVIDNCDIYDIVGTAPMSGIDLEPNKSDTGMWVKNAVIRNIRVTGDCKAGIICDCDSSKTNASISNVMAENCLIDLTGDYMTCGMAFRYVTQAAAKGCTISGTAATYAPETGTTYAAYGMQIEGSADPRVEDCIISCNSARAALFTMSNTHLVIKGCTIKNAADGGALIRLCSNLTMEDCVAEASKLVFLSGSSISGWNLKRNKLTIPVDAGNTFSKSVFEDNTITSVNWQDKTITGVKFINNSIGNFLCSYFNDGEISGNTFTGTFKIGNMENTDFTGNVYSPETSSAFTLNNIKKCSVSDNRINDKFGISSIYNSRLCHNVLTGELEMNGNCKYNTIDSNIIVATDKSLIIRAEYSTVSNNHFSAKQFYLNGGYTSYNDNILEEGVTATTDDEGNDTTEHSTVLCYIYKENNVVRDNTFVVSNNAVKHVLLMDGTFKNSIVDSNVLSGTISNSARIVYGTGEGCVFINNRIPSIGDTNPTFSNYDAQNTGHMFYNTTDKKIVVWTGSEWVDAAGTEV